VFIDVTISGDRNVIEEEAEEILKDLQKKNRACGISKQVTPVLIGAKGLISKAFRKYLNIFPR
jgi:predicted transcriptional regulator